MGLAELPAVWSAKRAVEIAAAGGHPLLLVGPARSDVVPLARCLAPLLPPLSRGEAEELGVEAQSPRPVRRPGAHLTLAELTGDAARPGEAARAHHGVLFLEELPSCAPEVLAALAQVVETGWVETAGVRRPAVFQLVATATSLPVLSEIAALRRRWEPARGLLRGFQLRKEVAAPRPGEAMEPYLPQDRVLERVAAARAAQRRRGALNARLEGDELGRICAMDSEVLVMLQQACHRLQLPRTPCQALARVARTVADLDGRATVSKDDVLESVFYQLWSPWSLLGVGEEVA